MPIDKPLAILYNDATMDDVHVLLLLALEHDHNQAEEQRCLCVGARVHDHHVQGVEAMPSDVPRRPI